jgi:CheY-like chemotaxis protein
VSTPVEPIQVLLVEDDPGDELMTREAFEDNKIRNTLHVVRDGEEALDFLYRTNQHTGAPRPDLILLDLNLPKYDGRQVLERIKSDEELAHILSSSSPPPPPRRTSCAATNCTRTPMSPSPSISTSSSRRSARSTTSS